jgi:CRISPR system Cascade subunit CasA
LLSLTDFFAHAHEQSRLELESPDIMAGVYRMLLAILHRAYAGPTDLKHWETIWRSGRFDMQRIGDYLSKWESRFDLWDERHPFLQDPNAAGDIEPIARLFVDKVKGNNATLFDHSLDDVGAVIPIAVAARRLIGAQSFALGGRIAGASSAAVSHPSATIATMLMDGDSMFETLVLNLNVITEQHPIPSTARDAPSWERDIGEATERAESGFLDLLTWRPRRMRLVASQADDGVQGVLLAGEADRIKRSETFQDPMGAYRSSKTAGFIEVRVDADRAVWRDSHALYAGDSELGRRPTALAQVAKLVMNDVLPKTRRARLIVFGFATDKAKVLLGRVDGLPIPLAVLSNASAHSRVRDALSKADEGSTCVWSALQITAQKSLAMGDRDPDPADVRKIAASTGAREAYWASLGIAFNDFILKLADAPEAASADWETAIKLAAHTAFERAEIKLGASSKGLKAIAMGSDRLRRGLFELFPTQFAHAAEKQ